MLLSKRPNIIQKELRVIDVDPDGNRLFRSVSVQVFVDAERHVQAGVVE